MRKSLLDHLIETRTALTCSQYYDGASDTDADEDARCIVAEFAGPPCDAFEPVKVRRRADGPVSHRNDGDICWLCEWPRGEHRRAK